MRDPVNVFLLCRNSIVREGLSRILGERDFRVVQTSSSAATLETVPDGEYGGKPFIILIDSGTDDCDPDNIRSLQQRFPSARLVMLSDRFDFQVMLKAFRNGVRGYIVKEISCEPLIGTLQLVAMGEKVFPSQLADEFQSRATFTGMSEPEKTADTARLSERELEILRWLIMGCPNKVISRRMDISEATVKVHVKAVLRKLDVKNRTQAAIWAANHGLRGRGFDDEPAIIEAIPAVATIALASTVTTPQLLTA